MPLLRYGWILGPALALGLGACGDDDGGGGGTDAGGGGTDGGGGTAGMCTSSADMTALEAEYDDGMGGTRTIQEIARDCAIDCIGEPEDQQEACTNECVETNSDLSSGCTTCVTASLGCTRDNCITRCLSDPDSMDCLACRCGDNGAMVNCYTVFEECAGVEADDCDAL